MMILRGELLQEYQMLPRIKGNLNKLHHLGALVVQPVDLGSLDFQLFKVKEEGLVEECIIIRYSLYYY